MLKFNTRYKKVEQLENNNWRYSFYIISTEGRICFSRKETDSTGKPFTTKQQAKKHMQQEIAKIKKENNIKIALFKKHRINAKRLFEPTDCNAEVLKELYKLQQSKYNQ